MKRLWIGAVVAALCGLPVMSHAGEVPPPAQRDTLSGTVADGSSQESGDEASDYAARDAAAPQQLAEFDGGADGVYIGTGAVVLALVIVLLLVAL